MDTKLTLRLDQKVIEKAKKYASNKKLSLSKIIETYLQSLTTDSKADNISISPFVESMSEGKVLPTDLNYKEAYGVFFNEKYQ